MNIYEFKQCIEKLTNGMSDEELKDIQISMTLRDEESNIVNGILDEITGIWIVSMDNNKPNVEMTLLGDISYSDFQIKDQQ